MFGSLLHKMSVKGSSVYGIELNLGGANSRYWTLVQLTLGKNREVKIVRQEYIEETSDAKQLADSNLKKSVPIVLCITSTGVLISMLNVGDSIGSLFPGLDEGEVYHRGVRSLVSSLRLKLLAQS